MAGALLRLVLIGSFPVGLNQDEASAGYEAWALLHYGMDRNGVSLPVLLISWGSGQNVLYSYLSMPFIAVFGLNEFSLRLLSGLLGSGALPIFYLLAKKIRGGGFGLLALLTLAVNPWHIMLSRWALESNLLPFFLLLGVYFLVLSREKPRFLPLSAATFALSLYSYGTAFLFLPLFLMMSVILLARRRELRPRTFVVSLAAFIMLALPIALCNLNNVLGLEEARLFGLTLPILTETRQAATTIFGGGGPEEAFHNFSCFLKLLWTQSDGLPWNSMEGFGLFYGVPGLLIAVFGTLGCVISLAKRRAPPLELFMLFALAAAALAAFLIDINVNRINMAFIPIIYFQALGLYFVAKALGRLSIYVFAPALVLLCAFFAYNYFTDFQRTLSPYFFEGLGEAIVYAESLDTDTIWITSDVNAPYIFVLFYNRIPPGEFIGTVTYPNPDSAFRQVSSFGKYRFGGERPEEEAVYIVKTKDEEGLRVLKEFGGFAVTTLP